MNPVLCFWVTGRPVPKGSWRSIPHRRRDGRTVPRFMPDNPASKAWEAHVAAQARAAALLERWVRAPAGTAVAIGASFVLPRPKHHYGSGKHAGTIKPAFIEALPAPHGTGDLDKLWRGVLDALTGVVYDDDSQVCRALWPPSKDYERPGLDPGAMIAATLI